MIRAGAATSLTLALRPDTAYIGLNPPARVCYARYRLCSQPAQWNRSIECTQFRSSRHCPWRSAGVALSFMIQVLRIGGTVSRFSTSSSLGVSLFIILHSTLFIALPTLVCRGGKVQIYSPFSCLLSKYPVMVTGMTPSTVKAGFVSTILSAGCHREV